MKRLTAMILALLMVMTIAAAAMGEENRIWQKGDTGEKVTWIQTRLKELEYLNRDPNGVFDDETEQALREFQADHNLLVTGMADAVTLKILETTTEKKPQPVWDEYVLTEEAAEYDMWDAGTSYSKTAMATNSPAAGGEWDDFNTDEYTHFESNRFLLCPFPAAGA